MSTPPHQQQIQKPKLEKKLSISISTSEKLGLVSNLSTMLTAGIPIIEVIDSLLEDAKGNQKKLLEELRKELEAGNHVATAFAKFPNIFDKVTVNLINAAEEAGTLTDTLNDLKDNIKKDSEFRDKIKSALMYPMFIVVVFIGVLTMMLTFVIPKIATVFLRLNVALPLPTKILIFMSNIVVNNTIPFIAGLGLIVGALFLTFKYERKLFLGFLFSLPLIANLVKVIDLTRFTRSMYLLLNAGVPISQSLDLAQEVVIRRDIALALKHANDVVLSGKKLSDGLKDSKKIIPGIMIKIIEAGEKSGSLDKSMQDVSEYLDYQVSATLGTLTALLEPIMLVGVGVLVGGMMLAIIAPIYGLIGSVGGS